MTCSSLRFEWLRQFLVDYCWRHRLLEFLCPCCACCRLPYQCLPFAVYRNEEVCDDGGIPSLIRASLLSVFMGSRRPCGCPMTSCRCPCPTIVLSLVLLGSSVAQQSILVLTCSAGHRLGHCVCPRLSMRRSHSFLRQSNIYSGLRSFAVGIPEPILGFRHNHFHFHWVGMSFVDHRLQSAVNMFS